MPFHSDSLAMAYALKLNNKFIALTGLINPDALVQILPNSAGRIRFLERNVRMIRTNELEITERSELN